MKRIPWLSPPKKKLGRHMEKVTLDFDPAFARALRRRAREVTKELDDFKSKSTVVKTLCLLADERFLEIYTEEAGKDTEWKGVL